MLQIVILGFLFIISALLVFGIISLIAGNLGDRLQGSSRAQIVMNRIAGIIYVTLAVKLATAQM